MTTALPVITATEPPLIHAVISYDPFDPEDCTRTTINHEPGRVLASYLGDLPGEVDWAVGVNGALVEPERWASSSAWRTSSPPNV